MNARGLEGIDKARREQRESTPQSVSIAPADMNFICDHVRGTIFYIEDLEDRVGDTMNDYRQSRERALSIIAELQNQFKKG